jgi:hypothetical protein
LLTYTLIYTSPLALIPFNNPYLHPALAPFSLAPSLPLKATHTLVRDLSKIAHILTIISKNIKKRLKSLLRKTIDGEFRLKYDIQNHVPAVID